jgi:hypothetical protein
MNEYIELTKKQINEYMKLVFEEKFNQTYCDLFSERYINIRYFNYYENEYYESTRKKILEHLKKVGEEIIINNIQDRELIETMRVFFYYVLYFDNVVYYKDLKQKISKINKVKKRVFNTETYDFEEKLYQKMQEIMNEKEELIKRFSSEEFYIKLTNYPDKLKVYRVNLKFQNIKFPLEFSDFAINKAFQMGLVSEDKLVIEYYLVVLQILKDVLKLNFKKKYVLEFAETLLKKPKKIRGFLNIINNPIIQEKISLKIKYEDFLKNKLEVYDLMREGYKITVILDNSFEPSFKEIESLQMFEFVIINQGLKYYDEIIENNQNLHNIIEI